MTTTNRRAFLSDVGRGMLAAGLGTSLANDLGFSTAFADQGAEAIPLGEYSGLVDLMRRTPANKLQPILAAKILKGETDLKKLIAAGALANAVTCGWSICPLQIVQVQMAGQLQAKPHRRKR